MLFKCKEFHKEDKECDCISEEFYRCGKRGEYRFIASKNRRGGITWMPKGTPPPEDDPPKGEYMCVVCKRPAPLQSEIIQS
jgi:hypothetical protein